MPPITPPDKVMFEIYKESSGREAYSVVYFTELDDHNRELEINKAMRGEHVFDGYLRRIAKDDGKRVISSILKRLNEGTTLRSDDIRRELEPFMG